LPCVKEEKSISTWKGECIGIMCLGLLCLMMEKIYNSCWCFFELVQVSGSTPFSQIYRTKLEKLLMTKHWTCLFSRFSLDCTRVRR
jgi:hypothetical protein